MKTKVNHSLFQSKIGAVIAGFCLLFNGIGALVGGWSLMKDPTGNDIQLAFSYLQHTPFRDYFIPGLVLFVVNGVFSLIVLMALTKSWKHAAVLVFLQGVLLTGWIVIQIILIEKLFYLQFILGGIGIFLMLFGFSRLRKTRQAEVWN